MLQKILTLKFLNIVRPLSVPLVFLGFSVLTAGHAMEEKEEKGLSNNLNRTLSRVQESENLNAQDKADDLSMDKRMDGEGEQKPFLPLEILSKILLYVEQFTLIQADAVCHFFKEEGDRIWETKLLDLSRKLSTPSQKGFDRAKTFAALKSGKYKNVRLQYCGLGDMDESSSLMNCKILDLSHNYIQEISAVCSPEALKHLQELNLSYNSLKGLEKFFKNLSAPVLKKLNFSYNGVSQLTVNDLKEAYKHLEILVLEPQEIQIIKNYQYGNHILGPHLHYEV